MIENENLMYLVSTPEVFDEYKVPADVILSGTPLESGNIFIHASKCGLMVILSGGDHRVQGMDNEGIQMYIEYVDGYATEQWPLVEIEV